jgi:hypothetical protein
MEINLLDVAGLEIAADAVRLSFNSQRKESNEVSAIYSIAPGCDVETFLYEDDYKLLYSLVKQGDSHAKVMRMVQVWLKIRAPRYWWQEMSTYKIGTTEMSESTIHRIVSRDLVSDDFEDGMDDETLRKFCNKRYYNGFGDKILMMLDMKHDLPESFLQTRIMNTNYQTLRHIYFDRKDHVLPQWHIFTDWIIRELPFSSLITVDRNEKV